MTECKWKCEKCNTIFDHLPVMDTRYCPVCKEGPHLYGYEEVSIDFSIEDYKCALQWLMIGDHGTSSETILCIALGLKRHGFDAPYDFGDFGRCVQLIVMFPQLKAAFPEVCEKVPRFKEWLGNWDEKLLEFKEWAENTPWYRWKLPEILFSQG